MTEDNAHNEQSGSAERSFNALPWITGAVALLVLAIIAGVYWERNMTVQKVHFEGYHFVAEEELQDQVDIPVDVHPDSIRFSEVIDQIQQIRYVREASIQVEPSGNLTVRITERQPIALLKEGSKKVYVDSEGIRLPAQREKSVNVPLLYGFQIEPMSDTLTSEAFTATADFLQELQTDKTYDATISEVAWSPGDGVVALSQENGVKLVFGNEDFENRLKNWKAFYAEVIRTQGIDRMQSVDMRFKGQVVTRES